MIEVKYEKITGSRSWRGSDFQGDPSGIVRLTEENIAEIDAAERDAQSLKLKMPLAATQLPLDEVAVKLNEVPDRLENGPRHHAYVERGGISMRIAA